MRLNLDVHDALTDLADRWDRLAAAAEVESTGPWQPESHTLVVVPGEESYVSGTEHEGPGWDVVGPHLNGGHGVVATAWADHGGDERAEPVAVLIADRADPQQVRRQAAALRLTVETLESSRSHTHDHAQNNPGRAACQVCAAAERIADALGVLP